MAQFFLLRVVLFNTVIAPKTDQQTTDGIVLGGWREQVTHSHQKLQSSSDLMNKIGDILGPSSLRRIIRHCSFVNGYLNAPFLLRVFFHLIFLLFGVGMTPPC